MGFLHAQGATEYLVLLAIVLIVALVSVALLGFFPGMASDSQRTQSEMYWKSASPIAITEWQAATPSDYASAGQETFPYFKIRNSGAYPIRITGIVGADGGKATQMFIISNIVNISDYYYMTPGEEKYFGYYKYVGETNDRQIAVRSAASVGTRVGGAKSLCANSTTAPGTLVLPSMGFEYIAYIDGQQITKRQIGKQVIIKCLPAQ